ncbi:hypothetical protein ETU10_07355 [Apibacter muscae]|uniref:hypothetical protein n=1 Tax=Apibacter muscae TaxID=2509004 RepID=UPI0011AD7F11|nr:hypothetical protein [Apibacter muscae]TWP23533.1 hypothetical protein ETU10_07355 [Apibacter muscae]
MTLGMNCKLIFFPNDSRKEKLTLYTVSEVQIETSYTNLTQNSEIIIARKVKYFDRNKIKEVFRKGDKVEIYLGYNGALTLEFIGYITQVSADFPISIKLEDEMYNLKKKEVNFSSPGITLKNLIEKLLPNPEYTVNITYDAQLGQVMFSKTNLGAVLDKLKTDWNIHSYFRLVDGKPVLEVGSIYQTQTDKEPILFHLERNCVDQQLNYRRKEDIRIKIKGICNLGKGKKIEVEFGDSDGTVNTLTYHNPGITKKDLEILVKKDYDRFKQDGMEGSFTALGIPSVQFGQKVKLVSNLYEERNGTFGIEGVNKSFSKSGYRQDIKLGFQIGEKK